MKKPQFIFILITVALLGFMSGLFLGRYHHAGTITAQTEKEASSFGKVDINNGTIDELCMIPGISELMAQRIIDYREEHGPFHTAEDLCNVSGISQTRLKELIAYVKVGDEI